jgi:hypothetical protein
MDVRGLPAHGSTLQELGEVNLEWLCAWKRRRGSVIWDRVAFNSVSGSKMTGNGDKGPDGVRAEMPEPKS